MSGSERMSSGSGDVRIERRRGTAAAYLWFWNLNRFKLRQMRTTDDNTTT